MVHKNRMLLLVLTLGTVCRPVPDWNFATVCVEVDVIQGYPCYQSSLHGVVWLKSWLENIKTAVWDQGQQLKNMESTFLSQTYFLIKKYVWEQNYPHSQISSKSFVCKSKSFLNFQQCFANSFQLSGFTHIFCRKFNFLVLLKKGGLIWAFDCSIVSFSRALFFKSHLITEVFWVCGK